MKKLNTKGFSAIEGLLILIILGIVGGVGYYVWNARSDNENASITSEAKKPQKSNFKTYSDKFGGFSIQYPADWKINTTDKSKDDFPSIKTTLTSKDGTVLHLNSDGGGRGGSCTPKKGDKPFMDGNACPSEEYLTVEKLPVDNVYYAKDTTGDSADVSFSYEKSNVVMTTKKYKDDSTKLQYIIGITNDDPTYPIVKNKPQSGAFTNDFYLSVYSSKGKLKNYIYAYASSTSDKFLTSKDADAIKNIFRSIKIKV